MKNSRREFVKKIGAAAALGAVFPFRMASTAAAAEAPLTGPATPSKPMAGALCVLSFSRAGATPIGALANDDPTHAVDLGAVAKRTGAKLSFDPAQMLTFIGAGERAIAEAKDLLAKAQPGERVALKDVKLLAPIPVPARNIYAVGWNYIEHFKEGEALRSASTTPKELPEHPVFFSKASHSLNEPFGTIPFDPTVSTMIDWEGELAVVIGRRGKNIPEDKALDYVFGFSVINDTTARDLQQKKHGGQWFKGKSLDGHGPMGPWIVVTAAGCKPAGFDHNNLPLFTRVNGVVKQEANTQEMYFKVPRIIAELSMGLTLEPGDIIATGTPPGVGYARKPPEFLKPGDVMETEIVGIGVIRSTIQAV